MGWGEAVQIHRMLEIAYLLLGDRMLTARALAERFEVSTRTVYRDVEALSAAGIPVYMTKGRGGGIALSPGFALGKAVLTEGEKADVLASLKALSDVSPDGVDGTLKKLGALFGTAKADWIEVDFSAWSDPKRVAEVFASLKAAILARRVVQFSYASGKGETARRTVEPLKLCFKGQAWYLYGHCRDRRAGRLFKLSRIRDFTRTEWTFERELPPNEPVIHPLPEVGRMEVTLRLTPDAAYRVYDEYEAYERLEDGAFLVHALIPPGEGLYQYVLSFGEGCEVLAPREARDDVIARLKKTLARYQI